MPTELSLEFGLDEPTDGEHVRRRVARALGSAPDVVPGYRLVKRSLDARRGSVRFPLVFEIGPEDEKDLGAPHPRPVGTARVVIVGDGPAGLFCAYELARRGIGSVVVHRAKPLH